MEDGGVEEEGVADVHEESDVGADLSFAVEGNILGEVVPQELHCSLKVIDLVVDVPGGSLQEVLEI